MVAVTVKNSGNPIKLTMLGFIWFFYSCVYLLLVNVHSNTFGGYFAFISQVGMDVIISILAFKLYQTINNHNLKLIYLLFFISAISAAAADGIYHVAMNIVDVSYFHKANSFFEVPFIFFLFFQVIAWTKVFFTDYEVSSKKKLSYLPYLSVSIFIFFTFVYVIPWKIHYLSKLGIYQLIDTFLEVIGFALSAICLSRSKNNPVRYLAIGYLFIVSSDLLIRYGVITGEIPFLSVFEVSWSFGLLVMAFGFYSLKNNQIKLLPLNSLQSHMAIWLLNLLSLFVFLFLCVNYFFPHKDISNYLLLGIAPCTLLAVVLSKYFASKILSPLGRLESIIKEFITAGPSKYPSQSKPPSTDIDDFILLEKFIYDAFELYKKEHNIRIEFAKMATQVAHDIKSPMIALNNYFKEAIQLDEAKYDVVESSLHRMNEIANNLLMQYKDSEINLIEDNNDSDLMEVFLSSLIEEKKLQFKDNPVEITLHIDKLAQISYVAFNAVSFKRTVSNLINNAAESANNQTLINVSLQRKMNHLVLEIKDNGRGIPEDILKNIAQGKSIQKVKGNGLGLPYAIKSIKEWGAQYKIESKKDHGTQFQIIFPIQATPKWTRKELGTHKNPDLILLDDKKFITDIWSIEGQKYGKTIVTFNHIDTFMEYIPSVDKNTDIYIDLNLDEDNGDEIAKELYLLGYRRLFITTGYDLKQINKSPWVLEVISKEPPFSRFSMSIENE